METLILHFGRFIMGVSLSCLLFMAFFMPVYLRITSKNKEWYATVKENNKNTCKNSVYNCASSTQKETATTERPQDKP